MKSLLILRHAEALPAGPHLPDPDRPLTDAGTAQALAIGAALAVRAIPLPKVVSSSAVRARETASGVLEGGQYGVAIEVSQRLYNAPGEELLAALQAWPEDAERALLVAHVPGVAELTGILTTEHVDLAVIFQAATLAEVDLNIDKWSEIDYGTGALRMLLPP